MLKILAIETSCDETAAAVVEDGRRICSSVVFSQLAEHQKYGGVVPEIASRRHVEEITGVCTAALAEAGMSWHDADAIAVTAAPGLIGALLVGVNFAKGLALALHKPLIPVHHLRGHLAANYLAHPNCRPPFLCLVVSGGHSHIVDVQSYTDFTIVARTRDDAAGEVFDKVARAMGLPYPGGAALDKLAAKGSAESAKRYPLPTPKMDGNPLDFSFSGLKTAAVNLLHNARQKGEEVEMADLAAAFRGKVTDLLAGHFFEAAKTLHSPALAAAGGVAANTRLRQLLEEGAQTRGLPLYIPPLALCGDNAAMIGAQAFYEYTAGHTADMTLNGAATMGINCKF